MGSSFGIILYTQIPPDEPRVFNRIGRPLALGIADESGTVWEDVNMPIRFVPIA